MKRTLIRRIIECLVLLAISAALWQLTLIPIASTINKKAPLTLPQNVFVIAAFSVLVILINLYAKKQSYINWKEFFSGNATIKWILFGLLATLVLHFLATYVGKIEGVPYLDPNVSTEGQYLVIEFMRTCILSPVTEELVFRRILTKVISPGNLKVSLLITGLIFTAIHMPVSVGDWVNQLGAAAILSVIYYKTEKVEACILVHSFMNLFLNIILWWLI